MSDPHVARDYYNSLDRPKSAGDDPLTDHLNTTLAPAPAPPPIFAYCPECGVVITAMSAQELCDRHTAHDRYCATTSDAYSLEKRVHRLEHPDALRTPR